MLNTLVIDDYFEEPDQIREIALSKYYRYGNDNDGRSGWRGERTFPIRDVCPCCNQSINSYSKEDQLILEYSKKIFNDCDKHFNFVKESSDEMSITPYFHITTEKTRNSLPYFNQDKFHADPCGPIAGVVYLTPDAPLNSGTSILYAEENQLVNVENKYNRLVAYESNRIHALSDVFGTSSETGRLTLTFFIHSTSRSSYFD